jgi:hypothetical protein
LLGQERWQEALAEARELYRQAPDDPGAWSALGEALFRAGLLEEAERLLEPRTESATAPGRALMTMGRLRDARGQTAQSTELMRRAVAAAPEDRTVLYWAAQCATSRTEVIALLERYLRHSEGDDRDRVESARTSVEGLRAMAQRPVWLSSGRLAPQEIPLQLVRDPITRRLLGYQIAVQLGTGNTMPVRLLLDSGSPGLYVIERIAKKRDFQSLAEITAFGGGGTGRHRIQKGFFPTVRIGSLEFTEALASATQGDLDPPGRYHGLLPLWIFHGYRLTLDLTRRPRLRLDLPGRETDGFPYWEIEGQLLVRARLEQGNEQGKEGLFLLDTGATRTILSPDFISDVGGASLGQQVAIHGFGGRLPGARALEGVKVVFQDLECGPKGLRVSDLSARSRLGGVEVAGMLGLDMLGWSQVVIDTRSRTIRTKPSGRD